MAALSQSLRQSVAADVEPLPVLLGGRTPGHPEIVARLVREEAEPIEDIASVEVGPLLDRIGNSRVVLIGEASHGTAEFYGMRARITRELIERCGFRIVAVEADWPDAAFIDRYARLLPPADTGRRPFTRFPSWMWRNTQVAGFAEWLQAYNATVADPALRVRFAGLDLYSLFESIDVVLQYLDEVDPQAARDARERYACLFPWERDPARYGGAAVSGRYRTCEAPVVATLRDLLHRRLDYATQDGDRFFDAAENARLVADAEGYYRAMYYGSVESWNLRDAHMFGTLARLLDHVGPEAKAVVWEHNSHLGDAAATEMSLRGEFNVGHLCRRHFGPQAYLVGFGTDHGTVAAADNWGDPMQVMAVRPAHGESYERICHDTGLPAFLLHLREPREPAIRDELAVPRLERAIGVIYRPRTELASHYFRASLPWQFDEYIWFDQTSAVTPVTGAQAPGLPETWPFGV